MAASIVGGIDAPRVAVVRAHDSVVARMRDNIGLLLIRRVGHRTVVFGRVAVPLQAFTHVAPTVPCQIDAIVIVAIAGEGGRITVSYRELVELVRARSIRRSFKTEGKEGLR